MENKKFDFKKFINDSKQALLNPKEYFIAMPSDVSMGTLIIKALIYGTVAGVFSLLWSVLGITGLFGGSIGVMALIWSIIASVIGLFLGGVIMLIISSICSGNTNFEANLRVSASLLVLMPISAFLSVFSGLNSFLGVIIGLAVNLWGIWMIYNALIHNLNAKPESSKILAYVLAGILVLFMLIGFGVRRSVSKFTGIDNKEINKIMKEYEKSAEDILKEVGEATKEYEEAVKEMGKEIEKELDKEVE